MSIDPDMFHKALTGQPVEPPKPVEVVPTSMKQKLDRATELALDQGIELLQMPIDPEDKALLRAKVATGNHVLTTSVRVEETKFKAARSEDTLNKLLELIALEEKRLGRT